MGGLAVAEARNRVGRRHELEKREGDPEKNVNKITPHRILGRGDVIISDYLQKIWSSDVIQLNPLRIAGKME